jgi:nucleoside-diphosphate-sugar epimerase
MDARSVKSAKVLVTGASGFLGRRLTEILVQKGNSVRLLLRPSSIIKGLLDREQLEVVRCAFNDDQGLRSALRNINTVYHCAGHSSDWGLWEVFQSANVDAVRALLNAAHASGTVTRFVHVSTTDVYGYPTEPGDETAPLVDVGLPYNRSKIIGDKLALEFGSSSGLPVTVVRPATIFGPRSKDWVVELGRLLRHRQVLTINGGRTSAGLVYVDDVAETMIRLADARSAVGKAYNVVDPQPVTWRHYFNFIADGIGVPRPWINLNSRIAMAIAKGNETLYRWLKMEQRPLLTRHVVLLLCRDQAYKVERLLSEIGPFPMTGIQNGLMRTIEWLRQANVQEA